MAQKPYLFTGEWKAIPAQELLQEGIGHYGGDYLLCKTETARGLLRCVRGVWQGSLMSLDSEACLWSTQWLGAGLTKEQAQDLIEAALILASICGVDNVGSAECCP